VLEVAAAIQAREEKIVEAILSGVSLADARLAQGYHTLQRGS
jgi:4-hydroxy-4-methyl-2-oxoglutarate aldolase